MCQNCIDCGDRVSKARTKKGFKRCDYCAALGSDTRERATEPSSKWNYLIVNAYPSLVRDAS